MGKNLQEVEHYLEKVKEAVRADRYRIEMNKNRQANLALYREYVIDEKKSKRSYWVLQAMIFVKY